MKRITLLMVFLSTFLGHSQTLSNTSAKAKTINAACTDAVSIYEDFEAYSGSTTTVIPDCWAKTGTTGKVHITNVSNFPGVNNKLYLYAYGPGQNSSVAFAVTPSLSNLQDGPNRLRFKAYTASSGTNKLEVGYFTDSSNADTFVLLETITLPGVTPDKAIQFTVTPGLLPAGIKNLVFKNKGTTTGLTEAYIDDVVWEPIPNCADVSGLSAKNYTSSSINLYWISGSHEMAWQYAYGPATVINPNTLSPKDVYLDPTTVIDGLSPATSYKLWVRSGCDDGSFGAWIGPLNFTTKCAAVSQFMEDFDASTTALPSCWGKVGTKGSVFMSTIASPLPPSSPTVLCLNGSPGQGAAIVALPPVNNAGSGTNRLKFKMRVSELDSKFDIGYLTDISDPSTFVLLERISSSTVNSYDSFTKAYGSSPLSNYLAFRNPGLTSGVVYLDDVVWENIATCPDISALATTAITDTSVSLTWTKAANETAWQYVVGPSSLKDPFSLTPENVSSSSSPLEATIIDLSPVTSYKVWMRSKCSGTSSFGNWVGPVVFTTTCTSGTNFSQNFDASAAMPDCWSKVGAGGTAVVMSTTGIPTTPNILYMSGAPAVGSGVCAMPPVSNSADGTYRLKFKCRATAVGAVLEVGYLVNPSDPASFAPLQFITASQTDEFENQLLELGTEPSSDVLAFRVSGSPVVGGFYIDDVIWEPIPPCIDISNLKTTAITGSSVSLSWVKGAAETKWQYAIGPDSLANPSTLTPVNVASTAVTIDELTPLTSYKVWVRSRCGTSMFGAWIVPIIFTTPCAAADTFAENFDAGLSLPTCWLKVGNNGYGYVANVTNPLSTSMPTAPTTSKPNALTLHSDNVNSQAIVALPPINIINTGDHLLNFKYSASVVGCVLEVGYLINISDAESFIPFETITINSITDFQTKVLNIGNSPLSNVLAFRNKGNVAGYIFIDDVSWDVPSLGVNSFDDINFSYYPNPVKDILNLSFDQEIDNVSVINLLGQQVLSESLNAHKGKVDVSHLSAGTYLVKVTIGNQLKMIKVLKE